MTSARLTNGSGSSSSRPAAPDEDPQLLPTPRVSDATGPYLHGEGGLDLGTAIALLPTPVMHDMGRTHTVESWDAFCRDLEERHHNGNGHGPSLSIEVRRLDPAPSPAAPERWGKYAAAVRRWERLTRPAPAPIETGPRGGPRLAARFVEWVMGLPEGWVTDVPGLTSRQAIVALGNGVVPRQASRALDALLPSRQTQP